MKTVSPNSPKVDPRLRCTNCLLPESLITLFRLQARLSKINTQGLVEISNKLDRFCPDTILSCDSLSVVNYARGQVCFNPPSILMDETHGFQIIIDIDGLKDNLTDYDPKNDVSNVTIKLLNGVY
jgi:hypothetical protein